MAKWWGKAVGEISKLREKIGGIITGSASDPYKLNSGKVDYKAAKSLYYNTNDDYKLGAAFAKPIINNSASFIGIPEFYSTDKEAQEVLKAFFSENESRMQKTTRNTKRDGDCYVWITREDNTDNQLYPERKVHLVYNIIPAEQVKDIILDPLTGKVLEYVLVSESDWVDESGNEKTTEITQRIGIGTREIIAKGDKHPKIEEGVFETPWNFIPIVHFKNEGDDSIYGQSDLEPLEPFLKAYHDVMLHAMQGSKMHSTPKLRLKLKDVKGFLANNFGVTNPVKFIKDGGKIDISGKELLILSSEDNAEFIEVKSSTGDAQVLLKLLFYCIVDVSELPEFVFGVHTPSSQASVKEQMPVFIQSIERQREELSDFWKMLARIVLAMTAQSENVSFETYATTLSWKNIDPRSGNEIADELKAVVDSITIAVNNELMSEEAAVDFLSRFIETMNEWETDEGEGEKERIQKTKINRLRMPDNENLQEQLAKINKMINEKAG